MSLPKDPMSLFDVTGKVALVTGASGAFGMVAARVLAGAGCKLVLTAGNADALTEIGSECESMGAEVLTINERPSDAIICESLVAKAVEAFGQIGILVVASGMNKVAKIDEMEPHTFADVMDANVTQSWLIARAAAKQMKAQIGSGQSDGGKIILVSSARGLLGHPAGYTAYCSSKAAVDGMTKALGCELGPTGITVNAIAPTVFRSPLTAWMFEDNDDAKAVRAGFLSRVPKGRLGEPEDLAGPLLFLASKASDFYTGHILYADGGYTAG
ncbi:MAG: SDR family oxidoreductase [Ahrensia sp.]|nr:SDR family oxidoreductase [Ahrensia sp.]